MPTSTPTTLTIIAPYRSFGSVAAITDGTTRLQIDVFVHRPRNVQPKSDSYVVSMTWNRYRLKAILFRQRQPQGKRLYFWSFTSSDLEHPYFFSSVELPVAAMFILECHQRLSRAVVDETKLNLEALHQ